MTKILNIIEAIVPFVSIILIFGFAIRVLTSSLIERKMQRKDLQYLHSFIVFISFVIIFPLSLAYIFISEIPFNITGPKFEHIFIKITIFTYVIQLLNTIFITISAPNFYRKYLSTLTPISLSVAGVASINYFMLIIEGSNAYEDVVQKIATILILSLLYLFIYIPYQYGLMKKLNKEVLVEVHLKNDVVLTNLFLSHRSFGKDLIFHEINDESFQKSVIISKENILLILNAVHPSNYDTEVTQNKINEFSSTIFKPASDEGVATPRKKSSKKKKKK